MEAIKYLAWHLIHACEDFCLHEKIAAIPSNDRKSIIQLIKWCLHHGKRINTTLTQKHLNEITTILQRGSDEVVEEFHFRLAMYVFDFDMEQVRTELTKLSNDE